MESNHLIFYTFYISFFMLSMCMNYRFILDPSLFFHPGLLSSEATVFDTTALSKKFNGRSPSAWIIDSQEFESLCRGCLISTGTRNSNVDRWIDLRPSLILKKTILIYYSVSKVNATIVYLPSKSPRIKREWLLDKILVDKWKLIARSHFEINGFNTSRGV